MKHTIRINLSTIFDSKPSHLKILINDSIIFNDFLFGNKEIIYEDHIEKTLTLKIYKTGKNFEIVNKKHRQQVLIKSIFLNDIKIDFENYCQYWCTDNSYLDDHMLKTGHLDLNGVFTFEIPIYTHTPYHFPDIYKPKETLENCQIAFFGGSQVFNATNNNGFITFLKKDLNLNIKNFGIKEGSGWDSLNFAYDYIEKNYRADHIFILLTSFIAKQSFDSALNSYKTIHMHDIHDGILQIAKEDSDYLESIHKTQDIYLASLIPETIEMLKHIKKNCKRLHLVIIGQYQRNILQQNKFIQDLLLPPVIKPVDYNKNLKNNAYHQKFMADTLLSVIKTL